jgi:hypothetical protein
MTAMLLAALLLVFIPSAAAASPPQTSPGAELQELTASRERLRAGDELMVAGNGCAAAKEVRFELYDPALNSSASALAASDGTFSQLIHVPPTAHAGRAWLRASCQTPESGKRVLQAVVLITRPAFVITWANLLFGLGTSLLVGGFGVVLLRQPNARRSDRRSSRRGSSSIRKRHRRARSK